MLPILFLSIQLCAHILTQQAGTLPSKINEASGVAVSNAFPGRVYHLNDSGSDGVIHVTNMGGGNLRTFGIEGFKPRDMEDLRLADCGNGRSCLFLADIGDNGRRRKTIEVILVEEPSSFEKKAPIFKRIRMRYPDGSHDAESLAVHPDGTIFLLTKGGRGLERLFKLPKETWQYDQAPLLTLEPAGTVDFTSILGAATGSFALRPTSMDISPDGRHLLVLTYRDAVEFAFNPAEPEPLSQPRRIPLQALVQQEAIAYLPEESAFIYTSERTFFSALMMKGSCAR